MLPIVCLILTNLLEKVPELRLGSNTVLHANEIKQHDYFTGFDFDACAGGYAKAPWRPNEDALRKQWTPVTEANQDDDSEWSVSSDEADNTRGAAAENMAWTKDF